MIQIQRLLFRSHFAGLLIGSTMLLCLYLYSDLFGAHHQYYEKPDPTFKTQIVFREVSSEVGIHQRHVGFYPPARQQSPHSFRNLLSGTAPAMAVADINGDGFLDVYSISPGIGAQNLLFINQNGTGFREEAADWGLADLNQDFFSEAPAFADLNQDGHLDLILGRSGLHSVYLNQFPKKKFLELKNAMGGYFSNPRGFAVLDFNRDGILDIFMGNYFAAVNLNSENPPWSSEFPRGDDFYGGKNVLLRGFGDGRFEEDNSFDFPYKNHTFFPGISDLNKDGWPDIFEGNDFSFDRLYYSKRGVYEEVTDSHIPKNRHGFAGMNSEIFDFNNDGWLDIYVSNIYGPPYTRTGNILWKGGNAGFEDVSDEWGVRRCGWSWGAKFVDLDLDGKEELIVGGGMVRGEDVHSETDGELYWYRIGQRIATPIALRPYVSPIRRQEKMNYFGYQRGCLFQFNEKTNRYVDVAESSGFARFDNTRALALIDFNNDGRVDVLTGNYNDTLKLFENLTPPRSKWLGLDLLLKENFKSSAIGSRVRIFESGQLVFYREIYPLNGHRGQNDPRVVYAISGKKFPVVEIKWPNGELEIFDQLEQNQYNSLVKGKGKPLDKELIIKN